MQPFVRSFEYSHRYLSIGLDNEIIEECPKPSYLATMVCRDRAAQYNVE